MDYGPQIRRHVVEQRQDHLQYDIRIYEHTYILYIAYTRYATKKKNLQVLLVELDEVAELAKRHKRGDPHTLLRVD